MQQFSRALLVAAIAASSHSVHAQQTIKLILPEGTRIDGKITLARRARMFYRGGKLRFALDSVEVPLIPGSCARRRSDVPKECSPGDSFCTFASLVP